MGVQLLLAREQWLDDLRKEFVDLLRSATDKAVRIEGRAHLVDRDIELWVGGKALEHVISPSAVLERSRGGEARLTNALVRDLAVAAGADGAHDQLLGRHEGELVVQTPANPRRVHFESAGDVLHENQDRIRRQECLRNEQSSVRAVVKRSLEELHAVRLIGVRLEAQHEAGEGIDAFAAHRITLVGHCRGTDLLFLEGLLDLADGLEHAEVVRELGCARRDTSNSRHRLRVQLARIRLPRYGYRSLETNRGRDVPIEATHLFVIAIEDREEARLCASRSLHAATGQGVDAEIDVAEVEDKVLHPERAALAHGRRLRRLQVRGTECRLVAPFARKGSQRTQYANDLRAQQLQAAPDEDEIGIICDVSARCAEMNERLGDGRNVTECSDVRHDVVTQLPLVPGNDAEVDIVEVGAHLLDCLVRYLYSEVSFAFGEGKPQAAPLPITSARRPELQHRARRVTLRER